MKNGLAGVRPKAALAFVCGSFASAVPVLLNHRVAEVLQFSPHPHHHLPLLSAKRLPLPLILAPPLQASHYLIHHDIHNLLYLFP